MIDDEGPFGADLVILAGKADPLKGKPFSFSASRTLERALEKVGIPFAAVYRSAVLPFNSPVSPDFERIASKKHVAGRIQAQEYWLDPAAHLALQSARDRVAGLEASCVVVTDELGLYALTGRTGLRKWRGSVLLSEGMERPTKVIPTFAPETIWKEYELLDTFTTDLGRAAREAVRGPERIERPLRYTVRPTFLQAFAYLKECLALVRRGPTKLVLDIETRAGYMSCAGISKAKFEGVCIPLMCVERPAGYWPADQEMALMQLFMQVTTHPNAQCVLQNGNYDQQFFYREGCFIPNLVRDTMLTQHAMFAHSQKGLDYLASIYCDYYEYWKDDGKLWNPSIPEDDHWTYNLDDLSYTWEVDDKQQELIANLTPEWPKLPEIVAFQNRMSSVFLRAMLRGVRTDSQVRQALHIRLQAQKARIEADVHDLIGYKPNLGSPKQMCELFYEVLGQTVVRKRSTTTGLWGPTADDEAMQTIAEREPILAPLIDKISAYRSTGVFDSTFVQMQLDVDGRIRCTYKVAGTVTYRLASSKNAFGSGGNLQNIPSGDEDDLEANPELNSLPNVRELFLPDSGMEWFDLDGDSADLRFVTWDSGCQYMKDCFAAGLKPYVEIAKEFYHDPTITKAHPSYKLFKAFCHATNYLGEPEGLSGRLGLPVHDLYRMQAWYFGKCPEIKAWQEELKAQIDKRGWIENAFGYRFYFKNRITKKTYNEGVAWKPQSSVGIWINRIAERLDEAHENGESPTQILLQVHDSLDGQFPIVGREAHIQQIRDLATFEIETPTGPMIIPVGLKTSQKSWGHCK